MPLSTPFSFFSQDQPAGLDLLWSACRRAKRRLLFGRAASFDWVLVRAGRLLTGYLQRGQWGLSPVIHWKAGSLRWPRGSVGPRTRTTIPADTLFSEDAVLLQIVISHQLLRDRLSVTAGLCPALSSEEDTTPPHKRCLWPHFPHEAGHAGGGLLLHELKRELFKLEWHVYYEPVSEKWLECLWLHGDQPFWKKRQFNMGRRLHQNKLYNKMFRVVTWFTVLQVETHSFVFKLVHLKRKCLGKP